MLGAVLYLGIGCLWIAGTDVALELYAPDVRTMASLQTIKGLLFVFISAALFYFALRMRRRAVESSGAAAPREAVSQDAGVEQAGVGNFVQAITISGLVLVIGALGLLGYSIHGERQDAIATAKVNAQNLAQVIEVETQHVFHAVDVTLLGLGDAMKPGEKTRRQRPPDLHALLRQRLSQLPFAAALLIVDRNGVVVQGSGSLPARRANVSDRKYFTVHRDNPGHGLHIGAPVAGAPAGDNVLHVSRAWLGVDGGFQGVIVAVLDPARIEKLYASIDVGKRGAVNLALRDGTLLARGPQADAAAEARLADGAVFRTGLPRSEVGTFEDTGGPGGRGRIISYRAVPGVPLVVFVELDEDEALAGWLHGARVEGIVALVIVLSMALLITILVVELRRRELLSARLADSEHRYRVLFDTLPLPAFVRDSETMKFIAVNEAFVKSYMYTREEFSGLTTWDIRPPEDYARYRTVLAASFRPLELMRGQAQHRRKDGTVMQVETSSFDLMLAGRRARISVINDITERVAAEGALRDSQMRLQMITDNLPATIAYIDTEERYRYVNRTHESWYGLAASAYFGRKVREVIGEEFYALRKPTIDAVLAGRTVTTEAPMRLAGRERYAQFTYVPDFDADKRVVGFYIFGYDITERRRAEQALRSYVERLEALRKIDSAILEARYPAEIASTALEHLMRVVPYWGATVRVIDFSGGEATVLATRPGTNSTYATAQHISFEQYGEAGVAALKEGRVSIVHDLGAVAAKSAALERRYQQGMRSYVRVPLMVESTLVGVMNLSSNQTAFFTPEHIEFMRTIADHLALALQGAILREKIQRQADELEERVIERTAQLAAANTELEAFSYSVSHDLRAPLRSINGFGKLLQIKNAAQLDDGGRAFLQRILAASERMGELIDDLLSLSRIARAEMRFDRVDLSALAREVAAELAAAHPERQVAVSVAPNLKINADRGLLRILLDNLIGNAWKYTLPAAHARIEIGQDERDGQTRYFVRDNGAGFDMAYANKLFGVFQRLHSESEFPGTGIGLATVKRIVHRHGGEVWAEGLVNQGATFYFTLGQSAQYS